MLLIDKENDRKRRNTHLQITLGQRWTTWSGLFWFTLNQKHAESMD